MKKEKQVYLLRSALMRDGLTISGYAKANGYHPELVRQAISRHWVPVKGTRQPYGVKTKQILSDLRRYHNPDVNQN